ncbi:MAG: ATP-binding cassette domain-containing protein ['Conium maculatum' witches'-broom phytoplasma]|nr:ATP-binding cassette domain-containing protein ['Conium maculatum' witches'-broom phytoplasma]
MVGSSGSGKSTLWQVILQLQKPDSGQVFYYKDQEKNDLTLISAKEKRLLTKELQIIFQDPFSSLDPQFKIADIIGEGLLIHKMVKNKKDPQYEAMVLDIMDKCGVDRKLYNCYANELSGGQRQRIAISRSLILKPQFVVCDEIVSTLDVSNKNQILDLLNKFKKDYQITFLFITHDLGVASYLSDRICVMHLGNIVEIGPTKKNFENPQHPYTKKLLNAMLKIKNKTNNIKEYQIDAQNDKFTFLFEQNQADLDWHEVSAVHFILCTLKK